MQSTKQTVTHSHPHVSYLRAVHVTGRHRCFRGTFYSARVSECDVGVKTDDAAPVKFVSNTWQTEHLVCQSIWNLHRSNRCRVYAISACAANSHKSWIEHLFRVPGSNVWCLTDGWKSPCPSLCFPPPCKKFKVAMPCNFCHTANAKPVLVSTVVYLIMMMSSLCAVSATHILLM